MEDPFQLPDIRSLYMPVQPTVSQRGPAVSYCEYAPDSGLQSILYCYWELKTMAPLQEAFNYRVVADGCIDVFFEPGNPDEQFVMGFCRKYTEFELPETFRYIGIRFLPTMFPQLFQIDASTLSNRYERLDAVLPKLAAQLMEKTTSKMSMEDICQLLDQFFQRQLDSFRPRIDTRFYEAIDIILRRQGMIHLEQDLNIGLSARQLRRLFQYYVGDSPKVFSSVVRFQHILRAKPSARSLRENKLFFDAGYYDQAHFIKAFRNFYGVSPSRAFGRE